MSHLPKPLADIWGSIVSGGDINHIRITVSSLSESAAFYAHFRNSDVEQGD